MFARAALVVVWTSTYLTSYSDYQTGFREPLLQPYIIYIYVTPVRKMPSTITIQVSMCGLIVKCVPSLLGADA